MFFFFCIAKYFHQVFSFCVFVTQLCVIGTEYDSLLKQFSMQPIELPLHMQKSADDHAQFKRKFGLYAMDLPFLLEFQCTTMVQAIDKKELILRAKRRLKLIEKEAVKTKTDVTVANTYV